MDVIQRRNALAEAFSAHDATKVVQFLHPSFILRGTDGVIAMRYAELLNRLPQFFNNHPEYKQSVEIESSDVKDNLAKLATRRSETLNGLWRAHTVYSRWNETWKSEAGNWLLTEETPAPIQRQESPIKVAKWD